jgi:outer membrane protein|tara:strand:- start:1861 stop:2394 length:534 start_codon:yes stop_codon:yes gene_type:complete
MINIKSIKVIIITFSIIFLSTQSKSETKIAFVEMDTLMRESLVGKSLINQLNKLEKTNSKYFNDYKKKLAEKKNKITSQKTILSKEEYNKKIISLNKDYKNFQNDGKNKITLLQSKRNKAMQKILSELKILLSDYSNENNLTFIIDQKNIIIGKSDLNITSQILKLLDKKLKKVSLN